MSAIIFQSPQNQIILPIIRDDIAFGLKSSWPWDQAEIETAVDGRFSIASTPGIWRNGGHMSFRAASCRWQPSARCSSPGLILLILDEPTNQLDLQEPGAGAKN
jgi:biotin transport system ATP-binding protein